MYITGFISTKRLQQNIGSTLKTCVHIYIVHQTHSYDIVMNGFFIFIYTHCA